MIQGDSEIASPWTSPGASRRGDFRITRAHDLAHEQAGNFLLMSPHGPCAPEYSGVSGRQEDGSLTYWNVQFTQP